MLNVLRPKRKTLIELYKTRKLCLNGKYRQLRKYRFVNVGLQHSIDYT